jgi:hypothetical protein
LAAYYYLASSLPMLVEPMQDPSVSSPDFLEQCRMFMTPKDYEDILRTSINPDENFSHYLGEVYGKWESSLRNELVRLRAQAQGLNPDDFLRESGFAAGTAEIASAAMQKSTPLEAELYLTQKRWDCVDELSAGHFFDIQFLQGYRLKLQLLERRAKFEEEKGFDAYRSIYARVLEATGSEIPVGGNNG